MITAIVTILGIIIPAYHVHRVLVHGRIRFELDTKPPHDPN